MVVHYIAKIAGTSFAKVACSHNVGGRMGLAREGTRNPAEVTCKKCLASKYMKAIKAA